MEKGNKKILICLASVLLAIFMIIASCSELITFAIDNLQKETQNHVLKKFDSDIIEDNVITFRNDIMNVTKRNLPRDVAEEMGDEFTLVDFETGESRLAHTTFKSYPRQPGHTKQSNFDKYMLLRQSQYLMKTALQDAENGTLKKHPGIKYLYGEVEGENNAVEKQIIIDPKYRSLHTTGLYLPAGEVITVKIENLKDNEQIGIATHKQTSMGHGLDYASIDNFIAERYAEQGENAVFSDDEIPLSGQYNRNDGMLPYISQTYFFNENREYKFGTPFGGILHLDVGRTNSAVKITFTGAVETPHFILGSTTEEYFEKYLRNAPGLYSCLDTENGLLIGQDDDMRKVDDIKNLALLWHSFFAVNESFTGGRFDANNLVVYDYHVPAGAAVSLGGGWYACPNYMYTESMNFHNLMTRGTWGPLHEIGHGHGSAYGRIWGFGGSQEGEVRNNALISLCYIKLCNMNPQLNSIEHGMVAHQYTSLRNSLNINKSDFNEYDYFQALTMYTNIMHSFGPDKFYDLLRSYKTTPVYINEKRADFAYRCYKIFGLDFRYYFNDLYAANIDSSQFTSEQIQEMDAAKEYIPIANSAANGANGIQTSAKYKVYNTVENIFDIESSMICPTNYTIESVSQPQYGTITKRDNLYIYKTNNNKNERFDSFDVTVKFDNGYSTVLNFFLEVTFSGSKVSYSKVEASNINDAVNEMSSKQFETTKIMPKAGVANTNLQSKFFAVSEFQYYVNQDGEYRFYMKSDDVGKVYLVQNNEKKLILYTDSYQANYNKNFYYSMSLKKGDLVQFYGELYNIGGVGSLSIGYTLDTQDNPVDIDPKYVFAPELSREQIEASFTYKYIPSFILSDKSNEKVNSISNSKSEWKVIEAPIHQDGELDAEGNSKRNTLIDEKISTVFHSAWTGSRSPMPHIYIIDTGKEQRFNSVKISTRNNVNSYIVEYELYISNDNVNYELVKQSDKLVYSSLVGAIDFDTASFRYFKLMVKSTTGGHFSVISEIDAGISTNIEKLISPNNSYFKYNKFIMQDENTILPNNYIFASKKNSSIELSFIGDKISIFGITGLSGGLAKVYIDGKIVGEINQSDSEIQTRQLLFFYDSLKNEKHTVKIETQNDEVFNIGYFNFGFDSELVDSNIPNYLWILWLSLSLVGAGGITFGLIIIYKKRAIIIGKIRKVFNK